METKALLLEEMERRAGAAAEAARRTLEAPADDPAARLSELFGALVHHFIASYPPAHMREVMVLGMSDLEFGKAVYMRTDARFLEIVTALVGRLRAAGALSASLPVERAARVLYSFCDGLVLGYMMDALSPAQLAAEISAGVGLVLRSWTRDEPEG